MNQKQALVDCDELGTALVLRRVARPPPTEQALVAAHRTRRCPLAPPAVAGSFAPLPANLPPRTASYPSVPFRPLVNTSRVFKNSVSMEVRELEAKKGADFSFMDVAGLMAGKRGRDNVEKHGNIDDGIWSVGQVGNFYLRPRARRAATTTAQLICPALVDPKDRIGARLLCVVGRRKWRGKTAGCVWREGRGRRAKGAGSRLIG